MILEPKDLNQISNPPHIGLVALSEPRYPIPCAQKILIYFPISPLIDILLFFTSGEVLVYKMLNITVVLINSRSL